MQVTFEDALNLLNTIGLSIVDTYEDITNTELIKVRHISNGYTYGKVKRTTKNGIISFILCKLQNENKIEIN